MTGRIGLEGWGKVRKAVKIAGLLLVLLCLAGVALSQFLDVNLIQSDAGDINIKPEGDLTFNVTQIQMRSPDSSWSCCGSSNGDVWGCTAGEC